MAKFSNSKKDFLNPKLDIVDAQVTMIPPRYTTTARDALSPVAGDMVYNTTTNKLNFYNGSAWEVVTSA